MMQAEIIERIIECLDDREHLVEGIHAVVFPISDSIVSKVYKGNEATINAQNEYCIGTSLFSDGISVPRMHGLIELPNIPKKYDDISKWVLLMERIHGDILSDIDSPKQYRMLTRLRDEQFSKARKLGYSFIDALNGDNVIYRPADGKLFLIDFVTWSKK